MARRLKRNKKEMIIIRSYKKSHSPKRSREEKPSSMMYRLMERIEHTLIDLHNQRDNLSWLMMILSIHHILPREVTIRLSISSLPTKKTPWSKLPERRQSQKEQMINLILNPLTSRSQCQLHQWLRIIGISNQNSLLYSEDSDELYIIILFQYQCTNSIK